MTVEDRVKEIIVHQLEIDPTLVTPETTFEDDLGCDSLDEIEMLITIEEEYGIDIPDDDMLKIKTVKDFTEYLIGRGVK